MGAATEGVDDRGDFKGVGVLVFEYGLFAGGVLHKGDPVLGVVLDDEPVARRVSPLGQVSRKNGGNGFLYSRSSSLRYSNSWFANQTYLFNTGIFFNHSKSKSTSSPRITLLIPMNIYTILYEHNAFKFDNAYGTVFN